MAEREPLTSAHRAGEERSSNRLAFADVLRGLAALIVVLGHFSILYLTAPGMVASLTNAEPTQAVALPYVLTRAYDYFNFGIVGVGVFFLISGFVIPLSLESVSIRGYFIKRFARIYPTYWVALALGLTALIVSSRYWSKPVGHSWKDYVANVVLVTEWSGHMDILSVAWTLLIEIKFYLLAPLVAWLIARNLTPALLVWGIGVVVLYWLATAGCTDEFIACWGRRAPIVYVAWEAMYITFMLIGSVAYAHFRGRVRTVTALALAGALYVSFVVSFYLSHLVDLARPTAGGYAEALVIFGAFYTLRSRVTLTRPLKYLADISYPLYVIHPLVGYVSMRLMMDNGASYPVALAVTLPLVVLLATAVQRFVEKPSLAFGKRLAAWTPGRKPATPISNVGTAAGR